MPLFHRPHSWDCQLWNREDRYQPDPLHLPSRESTELMAQSSYSDPEVPYLVWVNLPCKRSIDVELQIHLLTHSAFIPLCRDTVKQH